jgi:hypothetical protein
VELKPSLEELVNHSGVKGMKWDEAKKKHNQDLAKLNAQITTAKGAAVQAYNILAKGDYVGRGKTKGPWEEDSKAVDRLFNIREAVVKNSKISANAVKKVETTLSRYAHMTLSNIFGK